MFLALFAKRKSGKIGEWPWSFYSDQGITGVHFNNFPPSDGKVSKNLKFLKNFKIFRRNHRVSGDFWRPYRSVVGRVGNVWPVGLSGASRSPGGRPSRQNRKILKIFVKIFKIFWLWRVDTPRGSRASRGTGLPGVPGPRRLGGGVNMNFGSQKEAKIHLYESWDFLRGPVPRPRPVTGVGTRSYVTRGSQSSGEPP